jgi:hypothetical protein
MRIVVIVLLVLSLVPTWSGEERRPLYEGTPQVQVQRVALDADDPARTVVGPLTYLAGWHFSSRDPAFGGFSAMAVQGDRFLLLADSGLTFRFTLGADLVPRDYAFGSLPGGPGTGWSKRDRDSESLAIDPQTGRLWVGFERANEIWRYAPDLARVTARRAPPEMARWPENGGAETMVRLSDGRFLVVSEDRDAPDGSKAALLYDRDPTDPRARAQQFRIAMPGDYRPTDAVVLPDGRLLILARAVTLSEQFTAKLLLADSRRLSHGLLRPREIAAFAAPLLHDNFEGLAITREGGATILWMISDDNTPSFFQRSLLLKFRLDLR